MRSPKRRQSICKQSVSCKPLRLPTPASPSESEPADLATSDERVREPDGSPELSPLLTRAMAPDADLIPLLDVDLALPPVRRKAPHRTPPPRVCRPCQSRLPTAVPHCAQPADAAALERLPHLPMPLDGAPLDEARMGVGVGLEIVEIEIKVEMPPRDAKVGPHVSPHAPPSHQPCGPGPNALCHSLSPRRNAYLGYSPAPALTRTVILRQS